MLLKETITELKCELEMSKSKQTVSKTSEVQAKSAINKLEKQILDIRSELTQARDTINRGHEVYQNLVKHTDSELQKRNDEIKRLKELLESRDRRGAGEKPPIPASFRSEQEPKPKSQNK